MDDMGCPRCKTTKFRAPTLKLMVNACGHALCDSCVEILFIKGSAPCPECGMNLRRSNFRIQLFEDVTVEKEVDIRKRVLKDFNKREPDFPSLREYNDYLEEVECIIFNLVNDIDIVETNRKIEQYKKENKDQIAKGKSRMSEELLELEAIIEEEKFHAERCHRQYLNLEKDEKLRKLKSREAMIDDLMFSDKNDDANSIVARYKAEANAKDIEVNLEGLKTATETAASYNLQQQNNGRAQFSSGYQIGNRSGTGFLPVPKVEEIPLYHHVPFVMDFNGPTIPSLQSLTENNQIYLNFLKAATEAERAGGFHPKYACRRALQDAFSDITFQRRNMAETMDTS